MKVFGDEDSQTLMTRYHIAAVLLQMGKHSEALGIWESVYESRKRILGEEHPYTSDTLKWIQYCKELISETKDLETLSTTLNNKVLTTELLDLGKLNIETVPNGEQECKDFPSTTSEHNLLNLHNDASVLLELEKFHEALEIYQNVYELSKKVYGDEDARTLHTRYMIAYVLFVMGNIEDALHIWELVYESMNRVLGVYNSNTLRTLERIQECKVFISKAEHHNNFSTLNNEAVALLDVKKYDEALGIYQRVYELKKKMYGEENANTLYTSHHIALVLFKMGKPSEALKIWSSVYESRKRDFGVDHPNTLNTLGHIQECKEIISKQKT